MIGSLIMVQGPVSYSWNFSGYDQSETEGYLIVLTETSPSFEIEIDRYTERIVVTNLTTNGGTIRINAYVEDNENLLSINNISKIVEDGIAIDSTNQAVTINFAREDSDVEVTFTLEEWTYIPPPPVAVPSVVQFFIYGAVLFIIGSILLLKIETECREFHGQKRWRLHQGPLAIIVFAIIMASFAAPWIYGNAHGDFTERTLTHTGILDFSFSLTSTTPDISLDILDHLNQEYETVQIRVTNLVSTESIQIQTRADSRVLVSLPLVNSLEDSWIDIKIGEEDSHTLELSRVEADTDVSFRIIIIRTYRDSRSDPTLPHILVLAAIVSGFATLYQSVLVKRMLDLPNEEQYNSYSQQ
jgi:hypothetical protein